MRSRGTRTLPARLEAARVGAGYPPPSCVVCPAYGRSATAGAATGDSPVVLSRDELTRLVREAVERLGGA